MKFLNPSELSKRIYLDYEGTNFNGYKFRINNSPTIRTNKKGKVCSCTCLLHSIKLVKDNDCRFTIAFEFYEKQKRNISKNNPVQS